ncbi:alkaline phosphatase family protein [Paludisphaera borealis]|uniref:AP protein n=1 Tax=Paludisphaera borealis TaxID=1387353 RepID=A0A1U7CSJ1_9BACT|nr:alkaline phosphatase family protein [Paludisphaera borealis]APW61914.1 hypothetical protein BSF38_03446 [Paludisphaera borealis]
MHMLRWMIAAVAIAGPAARAWSDEPEAARAKAPTKTKNVILVISDGLRWQEVFGGAELSLISKKDGGVSDVDGLNRTFGQATPAERREALLPFITNVVAKQGRLFGDVGSESKVTNGMNFSYPGYNEVFAGYGDPRIDSNDDFPNPNVTVFEWLNNKDAFRDKVAAFGSWNRFTAILNRERSKLKIVACWEPPTGPNLTPQEKLLGDVIANTHRLWSDCAYDSFTFFAAHEHLKRERPRVMFVGFGETDEFAHAGQYDHYLRSANKFDQYVKTLWETVQSLPEYRDQTTIILTADHGRGDAPVDWKSHGAKVKGAERIWIGVLGPDTPPSDGKPLPKADQNQIAATIAALVGEDYNAFQPKAGPVIPTVIAPVAVAE